jgi:plastocyanin
MRVLKFFVLAITLFLLVPSAFAQDAGQIFVVQAGSGQGNYRAFAPASLQVHPGDSVRWITRGCNIHFASAETTLWLPGEKDGKPVLNTNPAAFVGTIQSGDSYTGGDANSGFPFGGPPQPYFELKIDAAPGSYAYFCDMYPGMVGTIEVVDPATAIPTPAEVVAQGLDEIGAAVGALMQATQRAMDAPPQISETGVIVTVGLNAGRAQTLEFFPNAVVIQPGQTVTWVVPENIIPEIGVGIVSLPVGVSRFDAPPAPPPFTFNPPDGDNPPSITLTLSEGTPSGTAITLDSPQWGSTMNPGDSFTLTFTEPGVYRYLNTALGTISGYVIVTE